MESIIPYCKGKIQENMFKPPRVRASNCRSRLHRIGPTKRKSSREWSGSTRPESHYSLPTPENFPPGRSFCQYVCPRRAGARLRSPLLLTERARRAAPGEGIYMRTADRGMRVSLTLVCAAEETPEGSPASKLSIMREPNCAGGESIRPEQDLLVPTHSQPTKPKNPPPPVHASRNALHPAAPALRPTPPAQIHAQVNSLAW
ncbi:hypothetical protein LZ30DRAFT_30711 [Colletotrichum cereale]|nr:hypothetical protein LZ30DRAFT_30711 [Colletotrichum cereale]